MLWTLSVSASEIADSGSVSDEGERVEAVWEIDPIVVTGTRTERALAETPVATELVTRKDLEKSGAESVADFLENQAGVAISHSIFGSGVQLQGLGSEYVLVLVDGERAGGRKGGVLDLSRYNVENIERIEIVKGNQSALYGSDAIGGVVNIITRACHAPLEFEARGKGGSEGRLDLGGAIGAKGGKWAGRLDAGLTKADPHDYEPADPETSTDGYRELNLSGHGEMRAGKWSKMEGRFSYLRRESSGVDGGTSISPTIFDRSNLTEMFTMSLSPNIWVGEQGRVKGTAYFSLYRDEYLEDQRAGDLLDQFSATWERMLQGTLQADRKLGERHFLSLGLEAMYENLESERLESGRSDRSRLSLFLQDEWKPGFVRGTTLLPGLRWDVDSQFDGHFTPKLAISRELGTRTKLRASLGKGFRAPDFKELYVRFSHPAVGYEVIGNPRLEPEISLSYSIGLEIQASPELWVGTSLFHHEFDNLIQGLITDDVMDSGLMKATYFNVSHASLSGFDGTVRYRPRKRLKIELGYSFLDSHDEGTGEVLDGRPRNRGNLNLDFRFPSLKANVVLRASLVGSRSFSEAYSGVETVMADPYALVNLRVSRDLGEFIKISLGADNMLNAGDHDYLRIAPRSFFLGLGLRRAKSD